MRGKGAALTLVMFVLSVGLLQLLISAIPPGQCTSVSNPLDETITDSAVQRAFLTQFYENIGQLNTKDVMFYGKIPGGMIGFDESRIRFWMEGTDSCVILSFVGASNVTPICMDEVSQHTSYFLGDRGTYTGIRGYSQLVYENLWPGIDLHYHPTVDGVKYEFHVAAGRDPTTIIVRCEGHDSLVIEESTVFISTDNGTFIDEGLRAFQGLTDIDVTFSSLGPHTFGFKVGDYDESQELIIDPLVYSTYVGGSNYDRAHSITVDSAGNAFVTGYTGSSDFPMVNAYNSTYGGWAECFVFKLSADGSTLLYSTFVGGSRHDRGYSIAVDLAGNAFVTGSTESSDFPIVNAYNSTYAGNGDCFVFKLSTNGSTLFYSTFIGGRENDYTKSIAVDSAGNAFAAGSTQSSDFPTVNAYNSTHGGGGHDCFVFKLSANGSVLLYSTFVGGRRGDRAESIVLDSPGNAFVTGYTLSPDFPTVNAFNSVHGVDYDCFVFKLSANGSTLIYSTFVGGGDQDEGNSLAVDSSGNAFVTGYTESSDFPTVNAYNSTHGGGGSDCFVFKLSANGSVLLYSTFVGGDGSDHGNSIAADSTGNVSITGYTGSSDFPTVDAYSSTHGGGGHDCFVFKLSANGSVLLYSTLIGGDGSDHGSSIAVDPIGNVSITGTTGSSNFPTVNAYSSTDAGSYECFVLKIPSSGPDGDGQPTPESTTSTGDQTTPRDQITTGTPLPTSPELPDIGSLVPIYFLAGLGWAVVVVLLIAFHRWES